MPLQQPEDLETTARRGGWQGKHRAHRRPRLRPSRRQAQTTPLKIPSLPSPPCCGLWHPLNACFPALVWLGIRPCLWRCFAPLPDRAVFPRRWLVLVLIPWEGACSRRETTFLPSLGGCPREWWALRCASSGSCGGRPGLFVSESPAQCEVSHASNPWEIGRRSTEKMGLRVGVSLP